MSLAAEFAAALERRYGGSTALAGRWTARRVLVDGKPCVAKLIPYGHAGDRAARDARFETERRVYAALLRGRGGWPVRLADSFRAPFGGVVVTTEFAGAAPWDAYEPSDARDEACARAIAAQVRRVHALGLTHGGLALGHLLLRPPSDVALISFAFARRATRDERRDEHRFLLHALFEHPKTRGVGFHVLAALPAPKRALVAAVGFLADDAARWRAAERARLEREAY
jgi:hypothetical protein